MESMIRAIKETMLYVVFAVLLTGVFLLFFKVLLMVSY